MGDIYRARRSSVTAFRSSEVPPKWGMLPPPLAVVRYPHLPRKRKTMRKILKNLALATALSFTATANSSTSKEVKVNLDQLLLGKDVRALLDMPAYKDGLDLYLVPENGKRLDDRGLDLKDLTKWLKEKGVGVERDEWVTITDVKVDSDRVEVHLGGGGEGRGASKNASKKGAGFKRAGGSRINFRYGRDVTDADLQQTAFLPVLARLLDVSRIQQTLAEEDLPPEIKEAVQKKTITEGMTYQLALLSAGEPDQKKVDDSSDDSLRETWFYLKDGHRWVVKFVNGKVVKVQVF